MQKRGKIPGQPEIYKDTGRDKDRGRERVYEKDIQRYREIDTKRGRRRTGIPGQPEIYHNHKYTGREKDR